MWSKRGKIEDMACFYMVVHVPGFENGGLTGMKQKLYLDFNNCKLGLSETSEIRDDHVCRDVSFLFPFREVSFRVKLG
jgi:hypothetical protein